MQLPERFSNLPDYAFPRLRALLKGRAPGGDVMRMTIGEPQHGLPDWVGDVVAQAAGSFANYPPNDGSDDLREAIAGWVDHRFGVSLDPGHQIIALNGTREGLFNAALALCPETKVGKRPVVLIPNPFYQVYAVAALAAGAKPVFLNATAETGFLPDFDQVGGDVLDRTAIVYLCSPTNPQGAVADEAYWATLLKLAEKHDFRVFADECYSEIYRNGEPVGALSVAQNIGVDPERLVVFHSLSKRSSAPGLRSGFAAGGAGAIGELRKLRAYAGAPLPGPLQVAAAALWRDEAHVTANRVIYRHKYTIADQIFADLPGYHPPKAGFFLWLPVENDEAATISIWEASGVQVLPGSYLSRDTDDGNPGRNYIRVALVAGENDVQRGLTAIRDYMRMTGQG